MEIGAILKEAREEKNISLESLQESTKIQKRYLKAIEHGNFHILPGTFYARAFIKEYAVAVGLNAEELLENHHNELPTSQPKTDVEYTRMQRSRREDQSTKSPVVLSILPKVIVILLVIVVFFIAFTLYKKSVGPNDENSVNNQNNNDNEIIRNHSSESDTDRSENDENVNDNSDEDNEVEEESDSNNTENEVTEKPEPELSLIEEGTGPKPESTFELSNADDEVILILEPTGVSWVDIMNDKDEYLFRDNTEPDTPIELDISGENRVLLNIGSAPNLPMIYINDIEFEYPSDPQQFVTQRIWFNITDISSDE